MTEKIDRRVKRTRKLLINAFMELIHEKNYGDITIKEITERADVAYVTFFRHYQDKDHFFMMVLEEDIGELKKRIAAIRPHDDPDDDSCTLMFEYVQKKDIFFNNLFNGSGASKIKEQMKAWYVAVLLDTNEEFYTANSIIPFEIAANHIAASCIELIDWWLKHGMQESSKNMGDILRQLIINGTWQIVAQHVEPVSRIESE